MAACCPDPPSLNLGSSGDDDVNAQDTEIRPGESVECYATRAGNSTGLMDDKTDYVPNKIGNVDLPTGANGVVDVKFFLTPNSTLTATTWKVDQQFDGVALAADHYSGQFDKKYFGQKIVLLVTVTFNDSTTDSRSFPFSPTAADATNQIVFTHPLPGAHCTSPFGPRVPPKIGASSMHYGADFSLKPAPTGDVLAAADGTVTTTKFQAGGAGNYIKIKHLNGAGNELCTTVYMHLAGFYVQEGAKVVAGQKIGKEGNTGIGTGPHLHFECRLPGNKAVDPIPYIKGIVHVAVATNPDNTAAGGFRDSSANAAISPELVAAKTDSCPAFGSDYPADPTASNQPLPTTLPTDPFERAWYFTMTHEVGPQWTTDSPADPEVSAGLIDTSPQRKKDGYVNTPAFPGGETKFGIAQGPNPSIKVTTMPYIPAKTTGYNNYWLKGPSSIVGAKPKTAIMLFDINYLHGVGNAAHIVNTANIASLDDGPSAVALSAAQQKFMQGIVTANPNRLKYLAGWLKRSRDLLSYVQSLS